MNVDTKPEFKTIRETAKLGIVSEHYLRLMEKRGDLPCMYSGNRCLINVNALIAQLNAVGKDQAIQP